MSAPTIDIKMELAGHRGGARLSHIVLTVSPREQAPAVAASIIARAHPEHLIAALAENAFVSLDDVATKLGALGVERSGEGFIVPAARPDALGALLQSLLGESVLMAFGGSETVNRLIEAVRPPPWWKPAHSASTGSMAQGIKPLMSFSESHSSLEMFGDPSDILAILDEARKRFMAQP